MPVYYDEYCPYCGFSLQRRRAWDVVVLYCSYCGYETEA